MTPELESTSKRGILNWVERVGNRLPDPITLFFCGALIVLFVSEIASQAGWQVTNPTKTDPETGELQVETVTSLFSAEGMKWIWTNMVGNFTSFPPLGVVLVAMLGIGVAERSGLIGTLLKGMVLITPQALLTPAVILVGVMSNMASDAGYIILPPLAAAIFARAGRSPLVGMAAVFAGVSAGFSANLLITALDPLLQSFTQKAAHTLDGNYIVDVRCNYLFMVASTFMISLVGWGVTRWVVERRFTPAEVAEQIAAGQEGESAKDDVATMTGEEKKGLLWALAVFLVGAGLIQLMIWVPGWSLNGTFTYKGVEIAIWTRAIVPLLAVLFFLPGLGYGIATGTISSDRDVAKMMADTMRSMGAYVVLAFVASQFVAWFGQSNLGTMMALQGVAVLRSIDMPLPVLVIAIVLLTCCLNIFLGSASAKWAILSTVFVPLFMGVGISPELTQAAYRVGDSVTNCITPLNPYMVIILVFMQRYIKKAGVGSLISLMLPYTIAFGIAWCFLLLVWMLLGLPLGLGDSPMFIEPITSPGG